MKYKTHIDSEDIDEFRKFCLKTKEMETKNE